MAKRYECVCPVCKAPTEMICNFMSAPMYCQKPGDDSGRLYPALPCKGKHTLKEIRDALGMRIWPDEDPNRIC